MAKDRDKRRGKDKDEDTEDDAETRARKAVEEHGRADLPGPCKFSVTGFHVPSLVRPQCAACGEPM